MRQRPFGLVDRVKNLRARADRHCDLLFEFHRDGSVAAAGRHGTSPVRWRSDGTCAGMTTQEHCAIVASAGTRGLATASRAADAMDPPTEHRRRASVARTTAQRHRLGVEGKSSAVRSWPRVRRSLPSPWRPEESDSLEAQQIAGIYRELRSGREDRKDEPGANDFHYGKMEMRRHSAPFQSGSSCRCTGSSLDTGSAPAERFSPLWSRSLWQLFRSRYGDLTQTARTGGRSCFRLRAASAGFAPRRPKLSAVGEVTVSFCGSPGRCSSASRCWRCGAGSSDDGRGAGRWRGWPAGPTPETKKPRPGSIHAPGLYVALGSGCRYQ
jgi:hypothetical protein